jgi:hypothetical protein
MEAINWICIHGLELLQTVGLDGSVLFAAYAIYKEAQARRVGNAIAITGQYRKMRSEIFDHPQLLRVLAADAVIETTPITEIEAIYAAMMINHLSTVYQAMSLGEFIKLEGLREDAKELMSLPIPRAVWDRIKRMQNKDFVEFISGLSA